MNGDPRQTTVVVEIRPTADREGMECDWGVIEHGAPRPDRGDGDEVGHLMLVKPEYIESLLSGGPKVFRGAIHSAFRDGDRVFTSVEYHGRSWMWELYEARWRDGRGPEIMVGRWPD